jgi:hypothetical protein
LTKPKPTNTSKKPTRALARVGDPYIAPSGERIDPEGFYKGRLVAPPGGTAGVSATSIDPQAFRATKHRNLKDLPAAKNVVNAISVVFMYTLLGVGDREIAEALGGSIDDITSLRSHTGYTECFQAVHAEFINANSDLLTSRIAAYSQDALSTVGTLAASAKKEETRLSASRDILDRAGVRPKDQEGRNSVVKNELRIIIVDGEANVKYTPDINLE